ncbi:ATP-binding protein [Algoriphagus halophilus]|uniref:ATP-binding protein n=1 Tax=Algoriphagus halophilus TaxID=226505 RepID=UPI0009409013|nr:ATP-binding protein [Algoriphagus halophilus]
MFFASCKQSSEVPFPDNPSGLSTPVTKPFSFPEFAPFEWEKIEQENLPKISKINFRLSNYPSQHFSIHDFKPLLAPISKSPINWKNPEEIQINLDTIQTETVPHIRYLLEEPTITKLGSLTKWENTTSGILRIGQSEGLLGNSVYAILDDLQGSIWFSTEKGIHRFTGDQFENYNFTQRTLDGNQDPISEMILLSDGKIAMIANGTGLYLLDIQIKLVEQYKIGSDFIRLMEDEKGLIWFSNTQRGVSFIDRETKTIKFLTALTEKTGIFSAGLFMDSNRNIWIGFIGKIGILNPQRNVIRILDEQSGYDIKSIAANFKEDSNGVVWIGNFSDEAKGISLESEELWTLGNKQGYFGQGKSFQIDSKERLWIVDNDTITLYDPHKNLMKKIPTGAEVRGAGIPSASLLDSKGNLWVGTTLVGTLLINPTGILAEHFDKSNGLASNDTWGMAEDKNGKIWLATYEGINVYDPDLEKLYLIKFPNDLLVNNYRSISKLKNDRLFIGGIRGYVIIDLEQNSAELFQFKAEVSRIFWKAHEKNDGSIWMGTLDGLIKYEPAENSFYKIDEFSGLSSSRIWLIEEDKNGKLWLGNDLGINVLDPSNNTVTYLGKFNGLTSDYVSMLLQTPQKELVFGGDNGFSILNLDSMSITNVLPENGMVPPIMYDMLAVGEDIYVGSENGIVKVVRPTSKNPDKPWKFTRFGKPEGFPFNDYNQATAIYTSTGQMWWAAAPILSVIEQKAEIDTIKPTVSISSVKVMGESPKFINSSYLKNQLSDTDSIYSADQSILYTKSTLPLDSGLINHEKIKWDSLNLASGLPIGMKVPYDQNSFNFSFNNPAIKGRDKILYRYVLEGADDSWSSPSPISNSKNYYNLVPGEYNFKVATSGFNGVWSDPASFEFTILPPWWQTWWAYLLFFTLFSGLTYIIVYLRSQWLQKENRILEEKVTHRTIQLKEKIEELKNTQTQLIQSEKMASLGELTAGIAHEIQNPLNFVNNFSEVNAELLVELKEEMDAGNKEEVAELIKDIIENEEKINLHGKRADAIVKGMLQHSRSSNGQKDPTDINALADEYLRLSYHGLRAKDKSFNANMETDFDPTLPKINVVAQDVGRVILNLITNAFHAASEKKQKLNGSEFIPTVKVTTKNYQDHIEILIKDNGNGISDSVKQKIFQPFFTTKPTGQGTGLGLSLSYDIIKFHGGEIQVDSELGSGAQFKLIIPKL